MTPSRHRRLVLAYDSNPWSDGSVLASASARAASSLSAYTTAAAAAPAIEGGEWPRAQSHYYVPSEHVLAYTNEYLPMRSGPRAAEGVHCTHSHAGTSAAPQWGKRGIWG